MLLKRHRSRQAELKLQVRSPDRDHGLIFVRETGRLGAPRSQHNLGQREYKRLIDGRGAADQVSRSPVHGAPGLEEGVSAKVVQERLRHEQIDITLDVYAHVLPSVQQDAATRVSAALHGAATQGG